jgi:hypothetical protein
MQVIVAGHTNRLVSNVQYLDLLVSVLTGFSLIIKLKEAGARRCFRYKCLHSIATILYVF